MMDTMIDTIIEKLKELENAEGITILYACESGSRAWGFPSPDSDFDVRFIYSRRVEQYLSLIEKPDTVGLPVNEILDIGGWDLKKSLRLFLKSNAPLYEWLQSPIVYYQNPEFLSELRGLMPQYFSLRAGANHYLSMAYNTLTDDLQAEEVKLKRYFYALRPALASLWILRKQELPPMEFGILREMVDTADIQAAIDELMAIKERTDESGLVPQVEILNSWLKATIDNCKEQIPFLTTSVNPPDQLDALFRKYI